MIWKHWVGSLSLFYIAYPTVTSVWSRYSTGFAGLTEEKKAYVVSNTLKAGVLAGLTVAHAGRLYDIVRNDVWDSVPLGLCAPWYVSLDIVSLARVRKMMWSTRVHHVLTGICGMYVSLNSVERATVSGSICVYALFSSLAFFVNGFLAARYLADDAKLRPAGKVCAVGYASICAVHWGFQAMSIWWHPRQLWVLPALFTGFVYDDLILMKWLMHYGISSSGPRPADTQ